MSMTPETLHPSILTDLEHWCEGTVVKVIDPSPGLLAGRPLPGLVMVVYQCDCGPYVPTPHTHVALYGPANEDWTPEDGPVEKYVLYAN